MSCVPNSDEYWFFPQENKNCGRNTSFTCDSLIGSWKTRHLKPIWSWVKSRVSSSHTSRDCFFVDLFVRSLWIYICAFTYIYMRYVEHMYIYHMYIHMHTYTMFLFMFMYVYMYICIYVYMYINIFCTYIWIYLYVFKYTQIQPSI